MMFRRILFIASASLVLFLSLHCDDAPTKHQPAKEYIVYLNIGPTADTVGGFHDDSTYCLLRYHLSSGLFDSVRISLPFRTSMATSADGSRLYIGLREQVLVLDTRSWDTAAVLPYDRTNAYENGLAVSPDDRLLALCQNTGTISFLRLLRTSDYSVVFEDSGQALGTQVMSPYFSRDSRYFYVASTEGFYQMDLQRQPLELVNQHIDASPMQSSRDNRTWYYLFGGGMRIYDAQGDSVVHAEMFLPGGGDIKLTPDEHYLFYTNPGSYGYPSGDLSIHVMDLTNDYALTKIRTTDLTDQNGTVGDWFGGTRVLISPDGRKLLVGGNTLDFGWLILDIPTMRIEKFYAMWMRNFTCQSTP